MSSTARSGWGKLLLGALIGLCVIAVMFDDRSKHRALGIVEPGQRPGGPSAPDPAAFERLAGERHGAGREQDLVLDDSAAGNGRPNPDQRPVPDGAIMDENIMTNGHIPA